MITPFIKMIQLIQGTSHLVYRKKNEKSRQLFMILFLSVVGAYVVRTSSLNDKLLSN